MRRVYYSYVVSIATAPIFWQGIFLGAATLLLARWLHVASIIDNFLSIPLREVPGFVLGSFLGAFAHGEAVTALVLVISLVITGFALRRLGRVFVLRPLVMS